MAEKEERIEQFVTIQQRTITTRDYETNDEIISRIYTRQEAINLMEKAICKISCACKYYACGNCTEFLEHYTPDLAEAALKAILGE